MLVTGLRYRFNILWEVKGLLGKECFWQFSGVLTTLLDFVQFWCQNARLKLCNLIFFLYRKCFIKMHSLLKNFSLGWPLSVHWKTLHLKTLNKQSQYEFEFCARYYNSFWVFFLEEKKKAVKNIKYWHKGFTFAMTCIILSWLCYTQYSHSQLTEMKLSPYMMLKHCVFPSYMYLYLQTDI